MDDLLENIQTVLIEGYTLVECAAALNVSRITLWRWLKTCENWKGVFVSLTVEQTCHLILTHVPIRAYATTWGIRMIQGRLRAEGYKISRLTIREALHQLMPELLERRRQGRLIRRYYDVFLPMQVWHMDSHDKLKKWGVRIHGAIDGGTHYIVYMQVCLNKKAETIYEPYRLAVDKFGHPLYIRSDHASEHSLVKADIERARPNTNAYRAGASTRNQRIEAFWGQLRVSVTQYFEVALHILAEEGYLHIEDPWHRSSIVAVFLPAIQFAVNEYIDKAWNCHKVRAINERGRNRPAHIPALAFQARQRQDGKVLPPPYPEAAIVERQDTSINAEDLALNWTVHNTQGAFEITLEDLQDEELKHLRDVSYNEHEDKFDEITCKFQLHVTLTDECRSCLASRLPFEIYFLHKLSELQHSEGRFLAINILYHTLRQQGRS